MDAVPRNERGQWSSLESVNSFSWSGSAWVGGMIVGKLGILTLFFMTAAGQFLATLPLVALCTPQRQEQLEGRRIHYSNHQNERQQQQQDGGGGGGATTAPPRQQPSR